MKITRNEVISKLAEAYYLRRCHENIEGCATTDWYFAECAVRFFEDPLKDGEEWRVRHQENFQFFEPLYNQLAGDNKC